jgi:transposase
MSEEIAKAVYNYSSHGSTTDEIAAMLKIPVEHIELFYKEDREDGVAKFKNTLRKTQLTQALNNPSMAIWLGKQYLNQRDFKDDGTELKKSIDDAIKVAMDELLKEFDLSPKKTNIIKMKTKDIK